MGMQDMFDDVTGKSSSSSGQGGFKFQPDLETPDGVEVKVLKASPVTKFRVTPDLNWKTGEIRALSQNDRVTWAEEQMACDYVGLCFYESGEDWPARKTSSFWLFASNIRELLKQKGAFEEVHGRQEKLKVAVQKSPYSVFISVLDNVVPGDTDAPRIWCALRDSNDWADEVGLDRDNVYSAPARDAEIRYLVRAWVLSHTTTDYESGKTYDDYRTDGALHPAVLYFKKSGSQSFEKRLYDPDSKTKIPFDAADPDEGCVLSLSEFNPDNDDNSNITLHRVNPTPTRYPVPREEIKREWLPWKVEREVNGTTRQPILKRITVREQIKTMVRCFGAPLIDYAFNVKTDIWSDQVPGHVKGAYEDLQSHQDPESKWLQREKDRVLGNDSAEAAARQGRENQAAANRAKQSDSSSKASTSSPSSGTPKERVSTAEQDAPGGPDSEIEKNMMDQMEEAENGGGSGQQEQAESQNGGDEDYGIADDEIPF